MDDDHGRTVINHDEWGRHQQMMMTVDLDNIMDLRHVKQSVRCVRKREERKERGEREEKKRQGKEYNS